MVILIFVFNTSDLSVPLDRNRSAVSRHAQRMDESTRFIVCALICYVFEQQSAVHAHQKDV